MKLHGRWIYSEAPIEIEIEDGIILGCVEVDSVPADTYLAPGFVDAQVNGFAGSDYSLDDLNLEHIVSIERAMRKAGATRHVATVVTSPQERITTNLARIADAVRNEPTLSGAIPGIHLEGPYISDEDGPRGAHDRLFVRDPDPKELDEWIDAADGLLSVVTLAPERKGAIEFIELLVERGIVAAIGHTGASPADIHRAIEAGATLSTHLGNGSHAMLPRLKNYLWEQLGSDTLYMGLICDGFHVPSSVVRCLVRSKGIGRTMLVSDVALYGGTEPGRYQWGSIEVEVHSDGHLSVADTPYLAGAGHTLEYTIPKLAQFAGLGLVDAIRSCTTVPCKIFGFDWSESIPVVGTRAEVVQFRYEKDEATLVDVMAVRGVQAG